MWEVLVNKILQDKDACERLTSLFFSSLEDNFADDDFEADADPYHFAEVLFRAYAKQDINELLLEICQKSMFDLLRDSYIIPIRFCGKKGKNPVLITNRNGIIENKAVPEVTAREYDKFLKVYNDHKCIQQSAIYLADGYEIMRSYTNGLNMKESRTDRRRGILTLYKLPDTASFGWTEAQAYAAVWDVFSTIQEEFPSSVVYYGQETADTSEQKFDEIGVLLPFSIFEKKMLHCIDVVDNQILEFRKKLIKSGSDKI